ncbi:ROK family protein (plasmid) [Streptomyces sp. BI20]|uniref:ROK family protein n=1 Tax=Streptomyces sp. BI20 TaxID=3403460 RepID=UPI003C717D28
MTVTKGGSLRTLRRTNQETLLTLLLHHGPTHRAALARLAGVSRTTVSTIVGELVDAGLLLEAAPESDRQVDGRARELLHVNPVAGVAAGLDFTLTEVSGRLTDLSGRPLGTAATTVAPDANRDERLDAGLALLDGLLGTADVPRDRLMGLGVGVPGQVIRGTGRVGPSLPGQPWAGVDVTAEVRRRLDVPLFVENNTRLEGVAEAMYGAGRGARHLFYFGLSSGIGSGIFLDGALYRGAVGGAGELGHFSVDPDGPACPCGNRGCLVQQASVPAVLEALRPALGPAVTIEEVLAAAAAGDRACVGVLGDVGHVVGRLLANVCNLLNPDRIVVGGELAQAGEVLLHPMRSALRRYAMPLTREVELRAAELDLGARAGSAGAAALVLREIPDIAGSLLNTLPAG